MFYLNQIYLILWLSKLGVLAQEGLSTTISTPTANMAINTTKATESSIAIIPLDTTNSPASSTSTATTILPPSTSTATTILPPSTSTATTIPPPSTSTATTILPPSPPSTATTILPPSSTINSVSSSISLSNSIPTSTVAINKVNASGDERNLPLWELIYPDQISTITADVNKTFVDSTATGNPNTVVEQQKKTFSKLFKVDDVANCEKFFDECLRQVLQRVMPKLQNNNDAAPLQLPIDPFYLNRTSFQYNGGPLNGYITVGYAFLHGLTSMKFGKILFKHGAKDTFKTRLSTVMPTLYVRGSYKADLKLNSVNVRPKGNFNITLYGVAVELLAAGEIYRRDEHSFLRLTTMNATAAVRKAKLNATGLIQNNRLNEIILNVTNQYWREILNILLPETRDNWSPIIRNAINAALSMVPFDFFKKV